MGTGRKASHESFGQGSQPIWIHACGETSLPSVASDFSICSDELLPECEVFEDLSPDDLMTAEIEIIFPLAHETLTVSSSGLYL